MRVLSAAGAALAGVCVASAQPEGSQPCAGRALPVDTILGPASGGEVRALAVWDPDGPGPQGEALVMGGVFTQIGAVACGNVAMWNGLGWSPLGAGIGPEVNALLVVDGVLYAGCGRDGVGINSARVKRWNGTAWEDVGLPFTTFGSTIPVVRALHSHNGTLYAGGRFDIIGPVNSQNIARLVAGSWASGPGVGTFGSTDSVWAINSYSTQVVAAGEFAFNSGAPGSVQVNNVARYNGTAWATMAGGMAPLSPITTPRVFALLNFGANLVAGGSYLRAGGNSRPYIAGWTGTTWQAYTTQGMNNYVGAMCVYRGSMVATGAFTLAGTSAVQRLARWSGFNWLPIGGGVAGVGLCAVQYKNELIVGGFTTAAVRVPFLARWSDDGVPWVAQPPQDQVVAVGGTAVFASAAAVGYDAPETLSYQWQLRRVADGQWDDMGNGELMGVGGRAATVTGATTMGLQLTNVTANLNQWNAARLIVIRLCGNAAGPEALLSVAGPAACNPSDIATSGNPDPNAGPDSFLTGDDFDLFINAFFNELRRAGDNSLIADLVDGDGNPPPDGFLTGSDFDHFVARFFEGC